MRIKLTDGQVVEIADRLTVGELKKLQDKELISRDFIKNIMKAAVDISQIDMTDLSNITYAAYWIKHKENAMPQEEFEEKLPLDMERDIDIYSKLLTGGASDNHGEMAREFEKATKPKKNKIKKFQSKGVKA